MVAAPPVGGPDAKAKAPVLIQHRGKLAALRFHSAFVALSLGMPGFLCICCLQLLESKHFNGRSIKTLPNDQDSEAQQHAKISAVSTQIFCEEGPNFWRFLFQDLPSNKTENSAASVFW